MCQGKLFQKSICLSSFILFWIFEILSTCSLVTVHGPKRVPYPSLVCFTSVLYCDKLSRLVKFDFVPLNSPIVKLLKPLGQADDMYIKQMLQVDPSCLIHRYTLARFLDSVLARRASYGWPLLGKIHSKFT